MLRQPEPLKHQDRNGRDRRKHGFKSFLHSLFMRRRKGMRRDLDHKISHYVDIHDKITVWVAIAIVTLSCTDSFFTLVLIHQNRAVEANPVMKMLIETDTTLFVAGKAALTILCLLFLIAHKNFWLFNNLIRTRSLLFATAIGYFILINYELVLLNI
jgi:hypothetical protein